MEWLIISETNKRFLTDTFYHTGTRQATDNFQTRRSNKTATETETKSSISNTRSGLNYCPERSKTGSESLYTDWLSSSER